MQVRQPAGAVRLRIRPRVACVSSVAGGEKTLEALRAQLEEICSSSPPLLLSIGQTIPRSWSYACSMLRALRDGRDPLATARHVAELLDGARDGPAGGTNGRHRPPPAVCEARGRPYMTCVLPDCHGLPCHVAGVLPDCHGLPVLATLSATECHGVPRSATECHGVPRSATECHCLLSGTRRLSSAGSPPWRRRCVSLPTHGCSRTCCSC